MNKANIPKDIQQQVNTIVEQFNRTTMNAPHNYYTVRFRGRFAYLDHCQGGRVGPVGRLEYHGNMEEWEFAIYKYSRDVYDPDEFWFPGSEELDGTVGSALKAVRKAYPSTVGVRSDNAAYVCRLGLEHSAGYANRSRLLGLFRATALRHASAAYRTVACIPD